MAGLTESKDIDKIFLGKMSKIKENEFTVKYLIPLLRKLGWAKVEFAGGQYEEGKDIICWRTNEIGLPKLGVAQVKRYRPSAKAADERSFGGLVTQLQQASEKSVPNIDDGLQYTPTTIYFITPYQVDSRALKTRFEAYESLKRRDLNIVDGHLLLNLMKRHTPDLVAEILGPELSINVAIERHLTNDALLRVLNVKDTVDISFFYCDLDFSMGPLGSKFIYNQKLNPSKNDIKINYEEWRRISEIETFANTAGYTLLESDLDTIESEYETTKAEHEKVKDYGNRLLNFLSNIQGEISNIIEKMDKKEASKNLSAFDDFINFAKKEPIINDTIADLEYLKQELIGVLNHTPDELKNVSDELSGLEEEINLCIKSINDFLDTLTEPKLLLSINGSGACKYINQSLFHLFSKVSKFNRKCPPCATLRSFLIDSEQTHQAIDVVLKNKHTRASILGDVPISQTNQLPRLRIGLDKVIDTDLDLIVSGEAGAGKTTSLQMYAKNHYNSKDNSKTVIYIPLVAAVARYKAFENKGAGIDHAIRLLDLISFYLTTEGVRISTEELKSMANERQITLLLDGLDEVSRTSTWIVRAITEIKLLYKKIQIVVSVRAGSNEIEVIPFFCIFLLPFDDEQQEEFVRSWLSSRGHVDLVENAVEHLKNNPEVKEVVRNPLLATILCVLAENKIPLPDTEIRIYSERLRLLFGDYDLAKGSYRITSQRDDLNTITRKISYYLHSKQKREETLDKIVYEVTAICKHHMPIEAIQMATKELVSPCNVLVPMSGETAYGFGHLRYQEFLAARELIENRAIDIGPLLENEWWQGALVMYAKMVESIDFLFEWISENSNFQRCERNLRAMVNARKRDNEFLRKMLDSHLRADDIVPPRGW